MILINTQIRQLPDERLQFILRSARVEQRRARTIEEVEESERVEEAARRILSERHPLGTAGREGLPDA